MNIVEKVLLGLQRRRRRSRQKLSRCSSLSTTSRSSSSAWEFSDWNDLSEDECDDCSWDDAPADVPEGFLAVYVGEQRKRYVIDARHLSHPWFKSELQKSAEEFGFHHKNGLVLLCELVVFERMIQMLEKDAR